MDYHFIIWLCLPVILAIYICTMKFMVSWLPFNLLPCVIWSYQGHYRTGGYFKPKKNMNNWSTWCLVTKTRQRTRAQKTSLFAQCILAFVPFKRNDSILSFSFALLICIRWWWCRYVMRSSWQTHRPLLHIRVGEISHIGGPNLLIISCENLNLIRYHLLTSGLYWSLAFCPNNLAQHWIVTVVVFWIIRNNFIVSCAKPD